MRAALNARASLGSDELARMYREVVSVDPAYARKIHPADPVRIVRALEVFTLSGEPLSRHHARHAEAGPRYDALFFAIDVDPTSLRARIERRTHTRWSTRVSSMR